MGSEKSTHLTLNFRATMQALWKRILQYLKRILLVLLVIILVFVSIDQWISWKTDKHIITDIDSVPHFQVAMVLGTSKYIGKTLNEYYSHRINSAIYLFQHGKIGHFLLSGDNAHRYYNEPWTMKRDLLKAGVPEARIALDYAGFRTFDSIVRAKEIFNSDHFLIITQKFHCERAIYIAQHHDINATCLAVAGPTHYFGLGVRLREVLARAKAVLDIYVLGMEPKFLGPQEPIIPEIKTNTQANSNKDSAALQDTSNQ